MAAEMHIFNDRHPGASLTALLGQPRQRRLRQDYATLAEALADNLPKPLAEEMATALGLPIKVASRDFSLLDADQHEARPYRLAPDAVLSISPAVMEATKDLLRAHGWQSRAWH